MRTVTAIASRELRAYFLSPSGYIIVALFLIVTGVMLSLKVLGEGQLATMRPVFGVGTWLLAFVGPAITMRLISEEYRLGTFESLMTCPVREIEVILGKFAGATGLLLVMLLPTVVYVIALETYGRPDYGEIACGYLGLTLAGVAYLASGLLASTFTNSQPVAFLVALFFWLTLSVGAKVLPEHLDEQMSAIVYALDPDLRLADFTIGLIDTSNIVYFVSLTVFFLLAATVSLQLRRS